MNKFGRVVIGFGNRYGQTNETVISEDISRLQLTNLKATVGTNPSISIKEAPQFQMGALERIITKKRNHAMLQDLLKVQLSANPDEIVAKSQEAQEKIQAQLGAVNVIAAEMKIDKFTQKTGSSPYDAEKYTQKYKTLEKAIEMYNEHQQIIQKFMKTNQCSRDAAIDFLEPNDYQTFDF